MNMRISFSLVLLVFSAGCTTVAGSAAYGVAADVERSECRRYGEPRHSECIARLERELERQERLVEERARERQQERERASRAPGREEATRERIERAID